MIVQDSNMKILPSFFVQVVLSSVLLLLTVTVTGDYELEVTFYRFDNPNQRCEECHLSNETTITGGCCDDGFNATGDQCSSRQCDMYFTFCHERPLNTSSTSRGCPTMEMSRQNNSIQNTDGVSFRQAVLGIQSNPVIFRGYQWEGTQFYMEFKDRDFEDTKGPDDLIDTLAIDLDIPVGASINRTIYTGRFNNAQVELSFRVVCAENYYGPDCTQFCNDSSCPCNPGLTGELCETNINDCEGVNCSGNGQCVDGNNSFVCECDLGFTGEFCEMNIDYCEGVNCSENGQCEDGIDSFSCSCDIGYTGKFCETNIDDCAGVNCRHNAYCVDGINSYTCKCNDTHSTNSCGKEAADSTNPFVIYTGPIIGGVLGAAVLSLILMVVVISLIVQRKRHHDTKKTSKPSGYEKPTSTQNQESTGGTRFYIKTTAQLNKENTSASEQPQREQFESKFHNPLFEDNVDLSEPDQGLSTRSSTPIYADIPDQLNYEMYADVGPVYATLESRSDRDKRYENNKLNKGEFLNESASSRSDSINTPENEEHYYQVP